MSRKIVVVEFVGPVAVASVAYELFPSDGAPSVSDREVEDYYSGLQALVLARGRQLVRLTEDAERPTVLHTLTRAALAADEYRVR